MSLAKVNLDLDGLTVGDTQLVASNGGVSIGQNLVVQGNTYVKNFSTSGATTLQQIVEPVNTIVGAAGPNVLDYSTGGIWYYYSIYGNFGINLINVPTTNNVSVSIALILNQGATGYIPNFFQVNGSTTTIRWIANTTPTPSSNKIDIVTFNLINALGTWYVMGNYTNYA
jgi:hypothetical protein